MATAKKSARKYDLFSVNVKGGAETQMNSSPLTHSQAVTMKSKLTNHPHRRLELREVPKSNPAARKTVHRVGVSETAYVRRPSQITRKTPTKRLVKRRVKKVAAPKSTKGYFPNPSESAAAKARLTAKHAARSAKPQFRYLCQYKYEAWKTIAGFHDSELAEQFLKAFHKAKIEQFASLRVWDSQS